MSFLSRRQKSKPTYLIGTPEDLARIGAAAFGGDSPHPPKAVPVSELDAYALAFWEGAGYPGAGSPEYAAAQDQFLDELTVAVATGGDWACVGAIMVANNTLTEIGGDTRYMALLDRYTEVLRLDGVAFTALPRTALHRYNALHPSDSMFPANWPLALNDVDVPQPGEEPPTDPLAVGEARRVAEQHIGTMVRQVFAERVRRAGSSPSSKGRSMTRASSGGTGMTGLIPTTRPSSAGSASAWSRRRRGTTPTLLPTFPAEKGRATKCATRQGPRRPDKPDRRRCGSFLS